ncbi:MAG: hypothetical protein C4527_15100 [Candidatus Omnitrophota bacterium]|jgi:predicted RNase H-like HicB family nuclease|nr:MAG: hypothetical protein C4527_15100 [Candidatus Omnitrophota bacterium]
MKYTVILTEEQGRFQATVAGLPDCHVKANTRLDALNTIRDAINRLIGRSEIVQLEVPTNPKFSNLHSDVPWEWFGAFKEDPTWETLFDDIERQRSTD